MSLFSVLALLILSIIQIYAIYNGSEAKANQFPYAIMIYGPNSYGAGVLISDHHVLTAAHVLRDVVGNETVGIIAGSYNLPEEEETFTGVYMESRKVFIHENFTMPSAVNDIGIIELPKRLNFSDSIQPIRISGKEKADLDPNDDEVVLSGWGHVSFNQSTDLLQYAIMRLIPLRECLPYRKLYTEFITKNNVCAMRVKGMPCNGDSGGAIVSRKTNKVVGIASFGKDGKDGVLSDCDSDVPLVSTRISSYVEWIEEKTGLLIDRESDMEEENEI